MIRRLNGMLALALFGMISAYAAEGDDTSSMADIFMLMGSAEDSGPEPGGTASAGNLFRNACSQCHDTERSTSKSKSYEDWLFTVRRMSAKSGANIRENEIEPIAGYLAELNPVVPSPSVTSKEPASVPSIGEVLAASSVSIHGTISLLGRKGEALDENEGFFPDIWLGVDWQPMDVPFSAQVVACTSCHDDLSNGGMNVELVEGSFSADLIQLMTKESAAERGSDLKLEAKAGRFVVPFGAYSGMAHPGVYRTLTNPLMYNMGRRLVGPSFLGGYEPVLPMPYADEGVALCLGIPVAAGFSTRFDGYAINGLQDGFTLSRSWSDNNSNAALGGRVAIGNAWISLGGSCATGELQPSGGPERNYTLSGVDATLRYKDWIRLYYEHARREEDTTTTIESRFSGEVSEVEARVWSKPKVSLLVRYDTIKNPELVYGGATIDRFTWGPNVVLPGGSLLVFNHEIWKHEAPYDNEDVLGFRWVVSF